MSFTAKLVIFIVGLTVLLVAGSFVLSMGSGNDKPAPAPKKAKITPWDGKLSQPYDASWLRGNTKITLTSIDYFELDKGLSSVGMRLRVDNGTGKMAPWIKNKDAFTLATSSASKPKKPASKDIKMTAGQASIALLFKKVPTALLGKTCNEGSAQSCSGVLVKGAPGQPFAIVLKAPTPPSGHSLGENKQVP